MFYSWLEGLGQGGNRKKVPLVALNDGHEQDECGQSPVVVRTFREKLFHSLNSEDERGEATNAVKAMGKMAPVLIDLLTGLNEVEREMTRDRVMESIEHRKATGGSIGGRPKTNQAKERLVLRLRDEGCSYRSIREQTGLALSTIRRIIAEQEAVTC